jgi:hypothetical protein
MSTYLGVRTPDGTREEQQATYWSLENEHWRVVGLDTGYHSVKKVFWELFVRLLNLVWRKNPYAQSLKTKLPNRLLTWLKPKLTDDRGLIFLSHHQFVTTLDDRGSHPKPGEQIAMRIDRSPRTALWFCGHGHRLEVHGPHDAGKGRLKVLSRTVGHGAETDVVANPGKTAAGSALLFADNRLAPNETQQGFTGFAVLTFDGPKLAVDYVAVGDGGTGEIVYREAFKAEDGSVVPAGAPSYASTPGFVVRGLPDSVTPLPVAFHVAG